MRRIGARIGGLQNRKPKMARVIFSFLSQQFAKFDIPAVSAFGVSHPTPPNAVFAVGFANIKFADALVGDDIDSANDGKRRFPTLSRLLEKRAQPRIRKRNFHKARKGFDNFRRARNLIDDKFILPFFGAQTALTIRILERNNRSPGQIAGLIPPFDVETKFFFRIDPSVTALIPTTGEKKAVAVVARKLDQRNNALAIENPRTLLPSQIIAGKSTGEKIFQRPRHRQIQFALFRIEIVARGAQQIE